MRTKRSRNGTRDGRAARAPGFVGVPLPSIWLEVLAGVGLGAGLVPGAYYANRRIPAVPSPITTTTPFRGDPVSKPRSAAQREIPKTVSLSLVRTGLAALLAVAGIAWVLYYVFAVYDDAKPAWMFDLQDWNFLIGFGALFLGLVIAAHPRTPLGRGRGVVVGMLGSFLLGLVWIILYYFTSQDAGIPVFRELGNYNLLVGIGFMTVGFVYATRWE